MIRKSPHNNLLGTSLEREKEEEGSGPARPALDVKMRGVHPGASLEQRRNNVESEDGTTQRAKTEQLKQRRPNNFYSFDNIHLDSGASQGSNLAQWSRVRSAASELGLIGFVLFNTKSVTQTKVRIQYETRNPNEDSYSIRNP